MGEHISFEKRMHDLVAEDAGDYGWHTWNNWQQRIVELAREADRAIAAEREACAKIADGMASDMATRAASATADNWPIDDITPEQVVNGYRMLARLIRARV